MKNENIIKTIRARIEEKGLSPEVVFINAGMTALDYESAQKGTLHAWQFVRLCQLLDLSLEDFEAEPIEEKVIAVRYGALMRELATKPDGVRKAIETVGNFTPSDLTPEQAIRIQREVIPGYPLDWLLIYDGNPQFATA